MDLSLFTKNYILLLALFALPILKYFFPNLPQEIEWAQSFLVLYSFILSMNLESVFKNTILQKDRDLDLSKQQINSLTTETNNSKENAQRFMVFFAQEKKQNANLLEELANLIRDNQKALKKIEELTKQNQLLAKEFKSFQEYHHHMRKLSIQFIPKSKTGAPFGVPTKKKADWKKWKKAYSILSPLRIHGYSWKEISAKIQIADNKLPSDRSSLHDIEKAGLWGLLTNWPPDISYFDD